MNFTVSLTVRRIFQDAVEDAKKRNFLRLDKIVQYHLLKLMDLSEDDILKLRKEKYFKMGEINGIRN